jgi:hypothetical protein
MKIIENEMTRKLWLSRKSEILKRFEQLYGSNLGLFGDSAEEECYLLQYEILLQK